MKKYVIIAAGGIGQRMGSAVPKQLMHIKGKPVIWHSINAFVNAFPDISVVVVAPSGSMDEVKQVCSHFPGIQFIEGGDTRFQSVKNGLSLVAEPSLVFVHDAVRCLITKDLLMRCYEQAKEKGSAVPSVAINDSVRLLEGNQHKAIDRSSIRIIQTPQVFKSDILLPAFTAPYNERFTDEATVVEANGNSVLLIEGEPTNIKITRPVDLVSAEQIMEQISA